MNTIRRLKVTDLPVRRGQVNYVVPRFTIIEKENGHVYALNGDHIHGIRDKGGISLSVHHPEDCPVCVG